MGTLANSEDPDEMQHKGMQFAKEFRGQKIFQS